MISESFHFQLLPIMACVVRLAAFPILAQGKHRSGVCFARMDEWTPSHSPNWILAFK